MQKLRGVLCAALVGAGALVFVGTEPASACGWYGYRGCGCGYGYSSYGYYAPRVYGYYAPRAYGYYGYTSYRPAYAYAGWGWRGRGWGWRRW